MPLTPAGSPARRQLRRIGVLIVGTTIVLVGVVISPLPGPGFTILGPVGLAILASEFLWARRVLRKLENGERGVRGWADGFARRISRLYILPAVAVFWAGAWWLSEHVGWPPALVWALAFPAFVPVGYLSLRIVAVRSRRGAAPKAGSATGPAPTRRAA